MSTNMCSNPPTFVYFSTANNGDFVVGLRQWHSTLQEFGDIQLNSLQFANVLFQFKALERQFMEEETSNLSSSCLDGIISNMAAISLPFAKPDEAVTTIDLTTGSAESPIIVNTGKRMAPPATPIRPKATPVKRRKKKLVETTVDTPIEISDLI